MRPATAKRKGRETESTLVAWLRERGLPVERRRLSGARDRGDIAGLPGVVVEVKSGGRLEMSRWMAELAREVQHDGAELGVLIIRPRGQPDPSRWWAVMTTTDWLRTLR